MKSYDANGTSKLEDSPIFISNIGNISKVSEKIKQQNEKTTDKDNKKIEQENKNVNLDRLEIGNETSILRMIEQDECLRNTFGGGINTQSRILNSIYSALIKDGTEEIGFIMIVRNEKNGKDEIDIGVLQQHRSKGYATKALDLLKDVIVYNKLDVEVQTKKANKAAIQSLTKNGFTLCKSDDIYNYYTLKGDSVHKK
jgi:ribosomal protein S18 acetylase RimI-like enzyme